MKRKKNENKRNNPLSVVCIQEVREYNKTETNFNNKNFKFMLIANIFIVK